MPLTSLQFHFYHRPVLICCDDCDRVWHPACHKPMVLNIYSKLHCMECKREEREALIKLRRKQEKQRRNQRRLSSGDLAGIIDDELVFVNVVGPSPCCAICGIQRHKFKPIPLPPAKRVLYASIDLPEDSGSSDDADDESVDKEADDIPLTTNVPKDVEVLNARSMRKVIKTFSSCSEAARAMSVNRSKLSRLCRKGGGVIGVYYFRYASPGDEGGVETVTSASRKRKRKKKKKKPNRPQKIIECVVKWPRDTFEEATAKRAGATARATFQAPSSVHGPIPVAPAAPAPAPVRTAAVSASSDPDRVSGMARRSRGQSVAPSAPTSAPQPSSTTTTKSNARNAPQQSTKRTTTGKPACSYGECLKQSQGRRFNYMCLVHFKRSASGSSEDLIPSNDTVQVAPPQTSSSIPLSTTQPADAESATFTFPRSGMPQQSDRLTETGKVACAYADCPKQSQGRRLNFMCLRHFNSITGGKTIEVPSGASGEDTSAWTCDNCGLVVPGSLSRCKCYRWRNGIHPISKKKKKLKVAIGSSCNASKASVGTSKGSDDEVDTADWDCDNCGRNVPGKLSRCKCYHWKNGIHPMSKKKNKLKQEEDKKNHKDSDVLDSEEQKVSGSTSRSGKAPATRQSSAAINVLVDSNMTDKESPSDTTAEISKDADVPNATQSEDAEATSKPVADEARFAYEPILDAMMYDSDGDDFPVRVSVKWPHESPEAGRSDDMICCNTCGEWYHHHCVSPPVLHRDKGGPRGSYKCPPCTSSGRVRSYNTVSSNKRPKPSIAIGLSATAASGSAFSNATDTAGTTSNADSRMRKMKCGQCDACRRPDCGECANCRDKKKFGGPHRHRQRCILKTCTNPQYRPLLSLTLPRSGIVAQTPTITSPPAPASMSPEGLPTNADAGEASEASREKASISSVSTAMAGKVFVNADILLFDEIDGRESHRYGMQWSGGKMRRVMTCRVDSCDKNSRGRKFGELMPTYLFLSTVCPYSLGTKVVWFVSGSHLLVLFSLFNLFDKTDGYCLSHFNEAYPNVAIMGSVTVKLCKVLGCKKNSRGSGNKYNGMCCNHHNESLRGIVHELKDTNERVQRLMNTGINKKVGMEPTKIFGQGVGKPFMDESELASKASVSTRMDVSIGEVSSTEKIKKRQREDAGVPGDEDDREMPHARKMRNTKKAKEHNLAHMNLQNEDDEDASIGPKSKKTRIQISVGQTKAGEKEEQSSRSRKGRARPQKAKESNATKSPPPTKKVPPVDKREEKDLDPTSKKILKIIRTAGKHPGDAKKQDQTCEALRKYANDLDTAAKVIELGGLVVIAAAMKAHEGVPMVQAEAIGTIADLVWINAEHGETVAELGFVDLIASAMDRHDTHPKINKLGCGFFRTCSYERTNADIVKKVGVTAVTNSMKRNPRKCDVLKEGSAFLQNMLVIYPGLARTVIKRQRGESEDDGVVPILVNALKNNDKDANLHEAACGVLSNVALIASGKSAIIKAGSIPVLMRVLKNAATISGDIGLKRTLFLFLTLLATDDEANVESMLSSLRDGFLEDTVSIIKQHPRDSLLLVAAFGFLKATAEHNNQLADDIVRSGVVKLVVSAMDKQAKFDQIQIASCALLAVIKHDGSKSSMSAAKRIINAIEDHEDDPTVLEEACHALYNLAGCASIVMPLIKAKTVREMLSKVKHDHPEECGEIVDEILKISSLKSSRRT